MLHKALKFKKSIMGGKFSIYCMFFNILGRRVLVEFGVVLGEGHQKAIERHQQTLFFAIFQCENAKLHECLLFLTRTR